MKYIIGKDRSQFEMFCLEESVNKDNEVRLIDLFVESLSLEEYVWSVYMLREEERMSMSEIAEVLDLSVSNVKVRLHRSKEMLKEKLYEVTLESEVFEFGFSRCDRITDNVMKAI